MSWVRAPPECGVTVIACNGTTPTAVGCIEDLREKREELNRSILRDEEEKGKIQKVRWPISVAYPCSPPLHLPHIPFVQDLSVLTERLSRINEDLARKMQGSWPVVGLL